MPPRCSVYWIYNTHNQAQTSIINSGQNLTSSFLLPPTVRVQCAHWRTTHGFYSLGEHPCLRLLPPVTHTHSEPSVEVNPWMLLLNVWAISPTPFSFFFYLFLSFFFLSFFFFYLFCFSSSGARAPDSCCTPYSSIRSGQMRIVETASGRRSVAPTPVKRCQRGSGEIL